MNRAVGYALLGAGVAVILLGVGSAYSAYLSFGGVRLGTDLGSVLSGSAEELISLAVRLGFLGLVIWGGSVLLSYGVKLVRGGGSGSVRDEGKDSH